MKHGSVLCCLLHAFCAVSFWPITPPNLKQKTALEQTSNLMCCLHLVAHAAVHLQQNSMSVASLTVPMHTSSGGQQITPTRFSNTQSSVSHMHAAPVLQLAALMVHSHALDTV